MTRNRTRNWPSQAGRNLPSIDTESSPVMRSTASAMACWSALAPRRASEIMATRLLISGASPKFVPRLASVGETQFGLPTSPIRTRAIVPLPTRFARQH